MQGSSYRTLTTASKQISCALACADRHIGPSTTSISVSTEAIQDSLINFIGRSQVSLSPSMLPNVISLELVLSDRGGSDDGNIKQYASWLLGRLPNLITAKIHYPISFEATFMPLLKLRHLDLSMHDLDTLEVMPFSTLVPELESACISCRGGLGPMSGLDFSGCQHLARLVVYGLAVGLLVKTTTVQACSQDA